MSNLYLEDILASVFLHEQLKYYLEVSPLLEKYHTCLTKKKVLLFLERCLSCNKEYEVT